ncbi:MAG: (Na+)-NQR maturation NqrM [Planctomycetaceae bacterium]|nr:(Na+)-NQR maturation NqrM [Planctomycetaceae bacterium]
MVSNPKTRLALIQMLVAFLFLFANAPWLSAQTSTRLEITGTTMGVVGYSVVAFADSDVATELKASVAEELESVNQRMSTYIADSEVSRFNQSTSTDWFSISRETAEVVQKAQEISELSDGAFDITVQPLVARWKFSKDKSKLTEIPDKASIAADLKRVGYKKLQVRLDPPALKKSVAGLQIDLSAIAKGYAVDMVAERLQAMGLDNFLIEVGGEVRASGEKPDETSWRVGIEKPLPGAREPYQIIALYHQALASSGDYRNFFELNGKRYSHTIDPRTGYPVDHAVTATSVIAQDCTTADAMATAIMVLGRDGGIQLANKAGVKALILSETNNQLLATKTANFPSNEKESMIQEGGSFLKLVGIVSVFFLLAVLAMAIGVICGRERIKGSCGGIAALENPDITPECSLCSRAAECNDLKKELKKRQTETDS